MNLILLDPKDFIDDHTVVISGRRFNHLMSVNKVAQHDTLCCGMINQKMGQGVITRLSNTFLEMQVRLDTEPPAPLPLTLILALPRPKMLKRIIESATCLGVKQMYLVNSWRVEKSFWQSPVLTAAELEKYMILGLEQSRDTILPVIHQKRFFTRFVTEELPTLSENTLRITAHPKTGHLCPHSVNQPITLAIGPEGGFIDIEIETLEKQGFLSYHIGQRILKVETAVPYLISRLYA